MPNRLEDPVGSLRVCCERHDQRAIDVASQEVVPAVSIEVGDREEFGTVRRCDAGHSSCAVV